MKENTLRLRAEDLVVDLPYGKSIMVAGIDEDTAAQIFGDDPCFLTCTALEAHGLIRVQEDVDVLITMSDMLSQDWSRLRRNAARRHIRLIGEKWTVEELREWRQKVFINALPAQEDDRPRRVDEDLLPEQALHQDQVTRFLGRTKGTLKLTKYWRPGFGRRKVGQPIAPELALSIILAGVRRYDMPEKHRWVLGNDQVGIINVIESITRLPSNTRFVVYDTKELGQLRAAVWEKVVLPRHVEKNPKVQVYEVEGPEEMYIVTRNLIQFAVHPLPPSVVDSFTLEFDEEFESPKIENQNNLDQHDGADEELAEEGEVDMAAATTRALNIRLPVDQQLLIVAPNTHHLEHELGKLKPKDLPQFWIFWDLAAIDRANQAPEQVGLDSVGSVICQENVKPRYMNALRRVLTFHTITDIITDANHDQIVTAVADLMMARQDGNESIPERDAVVVSPEDGSGEKNPLGDGQSPVEAPAHTDNTVSADTAATFLYLQHPPMRLSIPAGQGVHIIGINLQADIGLGTKEGRFERSVPSAAAKIAEDPPPNAAAFILLKSVIGPVREQLCALAATNQNSHQPKMVLAIPEWGVPQLREWIESVQIDWNGKGDRALDLSCSTAPVPDQVASARTALEDHPEPEVINAQAEPEFAEPGLSVDADLLAKYQAALLTIKNQQQQIQALRSEVAGLRELMEELEQDK